MEANDPRLQSLIEGMVGENGGRSANHQRARTVPFTDRVDPYVVAAARARDIAISAYIRRAAVSFAAFDQGYTYPELMMGEWPVGHFGAKAGDRFEELYRNGRGAGLWQIVDLA